MKKIYILFLITVITSIANAGTTIIGSIMSGGISRTYRLYIPTIYNANNPSCPLIINMHGYTSNATDQQNYTNFMPIADTANFLIVYPQGTLDNNNITFWNAGVNNGLVDDISFLSDLIDTLKSQYNINLNRVYSTGFSNGGFMSHILACTLNNKIAAIASVSGTFFDFQYPYSPNKSVPVMQIHGTDDATVPYSGGSNMISADNTVAFWVNNNNCNNTPVFTAIPNTNTLDYSTAEHYVYNNGDNGSTVELYKIIGGAHTWPGAFNIGLVTNQDINASKEIWRFFNQYALTPTAINTINILESKVTLYPNPAVEKVTVNFENTKYNIADIKLFNNLGKQISYQQFTNSLKYATLDMALLPSGIYFVEVLFDKKICTHKKLVVSK